MRRALILLLILGIVTLGCAEKTVEKPTSAEQKPTEQTPKPTGTPTIGQIPKEPTVEDINKTLTSVDELLKELQDIENVSFNL